MRPTLRLRRALALCLIAAVCVPVRARADGAFPNAMQLLAPANATNELHLGATFGLVSSTDSGATWNYICEPHITGGTNVILYARAADGTLLALADKLWRSTDAGCTWTEVPPAPGTSGWSDLFLDPTTLTRAYGVSFVIDDGPRGLWESNDEAQSFPMSLSTGLDGVVSVESATTDAQTIYATNALYTGSGSPLLARSGDAGATWTSHALPEIAPTIVRILAVSPVDANTLWLRATHVDANSDDILVSSDGGQTVTVLAALPGLLTGFARTTDGTLFAGDGNAGALVMKPGATRFTRANGPHLLCLTARGSRLFGCGDSLKDGLNLAFSDDSGQSWSPLLSFPQIAGPAACVASTCASDWVYQQSQFAAIGSKPGSGCASAPIDGLALLAMLLLHRRRSRIFGARAQRHSVSDGRLS